MKQEEEEAEPASHPIHALRLANLPMLKRFVFQSGQSPL